MAKDFTDLDAAIIARIRAGFTRFYEIWPPLCSLANLHATVRNGADRVVDRRLQALRKKGKVACFGHRWNVTIDSGKA